MRNARRMAVGLVAAVAIAVVFPLVFHGSVRAAEQCGPQPCTWNFNQIRVPQAQPLGDGGKGITVAVVDTWIDRNHSAFRGRVVGQAYCVELDGQCQPNTSKPDVCVHGTHVAGTVAAANYGVAPNANVLAVQVLAYDGDQCSGWAEDVAAGIRYAAARGVEVINLSAGALVPGLLQSDAVTRALQDAARAGVVVVVAAGNGSVPLSDDYGPEVMLIAATGPDASLATYSSRGGAIDLAAPGGDSQFASCDESACVLSAVPNGKYGLLQGTSMAAPHVAGIAALLAAQHPDRGATDVVSVLRNTAHSLSGTKYGLVNAEAALRVRVRGTASPTTTPGASSSAPGGTREGAPVGRPSATATQRYAADPPGPHPYATDRPGQQPDSELLAWPETSQPGGADSEAPPLGAESPPGAPGTERFPLVLLIAATTAAVLFLAWLYLHLTTEQRLSREWQDENSATRRVDST